MFSALKKHALCYHLIWVLLISMVLSLSVQAKDVDEVPDSMKMNVMDSFYRASSVSSNASHTIHAYLFLSFSLEDSVFQSYLKEAKMYGIPIVLNGVWQNDLTKTLQKIFWLNQQIKASIFIDPLKFETFHIDRIPALVLETNDGFDVIAGSRSIQSMLEEIRVHGAVGVDQAKALLSKRDFT